MKPPQDNLGKKLRLGGLALLWLGASLVTRAETPAVKDGSSAVWQIPAEFVGAAHAACDKSGSPVAECMIGEMAKAGAPGDAVSFSRRLYKQSHGRFWDHDRISG